MAGSYPDAPDRRMAYDADGTVVINKAVTLSTIEIGDTDRQEMNRELEENAWNAASTSAKQWVVFIFPELRDITGWFAHGSFLSPGNWEEIGYSTNTTDGFNGTWVEEFPANYPDPGNVPQFYRSNITSLSVTGARAIRIGVDRPGSGFRIRAIHIYGDISAGETPDRLLFIDTSTGLEFTSPLDWGDVPRGTILDYDIDIKNNSSSLTANTITLSFEDISASSDTWYTIKETGGSFASTLNISSIAAGVTYPTGGDVITVRLDVADAATLGLQAARLKAVTGSWT